MVYLGIMLLAIGVLLLNPLHREITSYFTPNSHAVHRAIELLIVMASCVGSGYYRLLANGLYQ